MRFEIVGKNISVTDAMRTKIEKKLSLLNKYLIIDNDTVARVVVNVYPNSQKIEVTIPTKVGLLRTEVVHGKIPGDSGSRRLQGHSRRHQERRSGHSGRHRR